MDGHTARSLHAVNEDLHNTGLGLANDSSAFSDVQGYRKPCACFIIRRPPLTEIHAVEDTKWLSIQVLFFAYRIRQIEYKRTFA